MRGWLWGASCSQGVFPVSPGGRERGLTFVYLYGVGGLVCRAIRSREAIREQETWVSLYHSSLPDLVARGRMNKVLSEAAVLLCLLQQY